MRCIYLVVALFVVSACGGAQNGTICQSGPKYGTQCYVNTGTGDPIPTYSSPGAGAPSQPETPPPTTPNTPSR